MSTAIATLQLVTPVPIRTIARLIMRTAVIVLVAGVIVVGAAAIGSSPVASKLPRTFLPFTELQQIGAQARGGQQQQASLQVAPRGGPSAANQALFSGRNAPSITNGLRQEVPFLLVFAALTAIAALALRVLQPRRKRRQQQQRQFSNLAAAA